MKTQMKRYQAPKFWRIPKKSKTWVVKPLPGPHKKYKCIPLIIVLRDILKYAQTGKEARTILNQGKILVDKKTVKEGKHPVGLMDVIEVPEIKKYFRVDVGKHGPVIDEIRKGDSDKKLCRIENKKTIKKGKIQLNLHDGRNIILDKDNYKRLDSLVIKLPDQTILKHYKFEKGQPAIIIDGRNKGVKGKIKKIKQRKNMLEKSSVTISAKERDVETLMDYVLVGDLIPTDTREKK